jgi:hypothetical protein
MGVAELGYDLPSPRHRLRLWLPSPKLGGGVGGEGKIYALYLDPATPEDALLKTICRDLTI